VIFLRIGAFPTALFYYLAAKRARRASRRFLGKAGEKGFSLGSLRHFAAFALTVVEEMEAWGGRAALDRIHFQEDDIGELRADLEGGRGAFLICSHLGNTELLRGLADLNRTGLSREIPVTSIVDFSAAPRFRRMLRELNPRSALRVIRTGDFGPGTIILLRERIAAGELVVIAGDRTSASVRDSGFLFPFLNEEAPFAYGPFLLAALLGAPVYFVFALRRGDLSLSPKYDMHVHRSGISFDCSRKEREGRIRELAGDFAGRLEEYCKQHPYQWYNFYDFWAKPADYGGPIRSMLRKARVSRENQRSSGSPDSPDSGPSAPAGSSRETARTYSSPAGPANS
jgi:predicted LPLAT superfamily acyltransferase